MAPPGLLRRASVAYVGWINGVVDRLASRATGISPPPSSASLSPAASASMAAEPSLPTHLPVCFTQTATASPSPLHSAWHWLGYGAQPPARRVFWLDPSDDASAFRVLTDRPFGGSSSAFVRVEERRGEGGAIERVLVYEGVLHPVPPFAPQGSRWKEDLIRPPSSPPTSSSSPTPPSTAGPTGLTTPTGQLNGFSSLTSPTYAFPDLNLSPYSHLAFRMTTDGRPYTLSIRCRERLPLVYQARVPPHPFNNPRPLHFKTVPFDAFLTTFNGRQRTVQFPLPKGRVASFGIGVNGPPGPFRVELHEVWARQGLTEWQRTRMSAEEREQWDRDDQQSRGERFLWWLDDGEKKRVAEFDDTPENRRQRAAEKEERQRLGPESYEELERLRSLELEADTEELPERTSTASEGKKQER